MISLQSMCSQFFELQPHTSEQNMQVIIMKHVIIPWNEILCKDPRGWSGRVLVAGQSLFCIEECWQSKLPMLKTYPFWHRWMGHLYLTQKGDTYLSFIYICHLYRPINSLLIVNFLYKEANQGATNCRTHRWGYQTEAWRWNMMLSMWNTACGFYADF